MIFVCAEIANTLQFIFTKK